jgi:hypothetical protein
MTRTIVALFDDIATARQVVEELVGADFERSSISLVTNDAHNQYLHYLDKEYVPRDDAVTAGEGAGFGAVVGALTGLLAGLAALMIPGIGVVIVAGPIVAGLTGAVAGALTGGVVGALVKSGVPEDEAPYYAEGIRRGGTLISIDTTETLRASDIMHRHGSINIHERSNEWRQSGWKDFDGETFDHVVPAPPSSEFHSVITDVVGSGSTPTTSYSSPITVVPTETTSEWVPSINDEDTAKSKSVQVLVTTPTPSISDLLTNEPVIVMVEKTRHDEYEAPDK